jgi:RNA:NAD 2'-phosphotransferase (TPT1/KptA family)
MKARNLTLNMIKDIVRLDAKQRYDLILEDARGSKVAIDLNATSSDAVDTIWWIKARQGHSIKVKSLLPRSTIDCLYLVTDSPTRVETYHLH